MSDRELLELAAKAAGIAIEWERNPAFIQERWEAHVQCGWIGQPTRREWNPIREPSDRYALAKALGMVLDFSDSNRHAVRYWIGNEEVPRAFEWKAGDALAEGQAVVSAAAEIGKSLSSTSHGQEPASDGGQG